MDGTRFDALARGFSARLTRRRAIAALVGLAGATLAVGAADDALARTCRLADAKCVNNAQCCTGSCDTARSTRRSRRNRCVCPPNESNCRGSCFDLQTDDANCGSCGVQCIAEQSCTGGECVCDDPNPDFCGGRCVDLESDAENCGGCGLACAPGFSCDGGTCRCGGDLTCDGGELCCNDTCTDVSKEPNCGACGNACGSDRICLNSECRGCEPPTSTGNCGSGDRRCDIDASGQQYLINNWQYDGTSCTANSDCPSGKFCIVYRNSIVNGVDIDFPTGQCWGVDVCTP